MHENFVYNTVESHVYLLVCEIGVREKTWTPFKSEQILFVQEHEDSDKTEEVINGYTVR